jgi:hypothetical protein
VTLHEAGALINDRPLHVAAGLELAPMALVPAMTGNETSCALIFAFERGIILSMGHNVSGKLVSSCRNVAGT